MRSVQQPSCPAVLDGPESLGAAEIVLATRYYDADPRPTTAFKHEVYKNGAVRDCLNEAFEFKCAYCESNYGATQPVDIEHYRPKGEIVTPAGTSLKPGYYWLAATWNNLLPACIDCNRRRKQTGRDGIARSAGKGSQFPLADERARIRTPGQSVSAEEPLLLSPYDDHPERHLEFLKNGVVRPSPDAGRPSGEDLRGRTTIDVAALNRPRLARARMAHARLVSIQLARIAEAENSIRRYPEDAAFPLQLRRELDELRKMRKPGAPYVALTNQMIAEHRGKS
jgi:uncharacterized protein (TIGR02646 family)